jgi:hypothetical protein
MMTPEERLRILEQLEERQEHNQRRAVRAVWGSVIVAAVVLAVLIGFSVWVGRDVANLQAEKERLSTAITELNRQKEALEASRRAAVSALSNVPERERRAAIDRQFAVAPQVAAVLPRVYMHIAGVNDRDRAEQMRKALTEAGYVVLGIERLPQARNVKVTEVRFYRKADEKEARGIASVLRKTGEAKVEVNHLERLETSTRVRPNHFEVWIAPMRRPSAGD